MTETVMPLYCANHPRRETKLRCNRCEKPICEKCAVLTPTGYRCHECVRGQQKVFDNVRWYDYLLGFVSAAALSLVASLVVAWISSYFWGIIVLAVAPTAGALIARGVQFVLHKHRSAALFWVCAAGVVAGALPVILFWVFPSLLFIFTRGFQYAFYSLLPLIWQIVYLAVATPIVYTRLSGIHFGR